mmetsp:Transcript_56362/g.103384  ORF Transcript_56362/g.103384 Transcript_56362/m.103384 type:complete len:87 (+) Transcript_56362:200-460(+)
MGTSHHLSLHELYYLFHRTIMITLQAAPLLIPLISWALAITTSIHVQLELCATNAKVVAERMRLSASISGGQLMTGSMGDALSFTL